MAKADFIHSQLQTIEQSPFDKTHYQSLVTGTFLTFGQSGKQVIGVREMLIAFLRQTQGIGGFKASIMRYLTVAMGENHEFNFKKALNIYKHVGSCF